VGLFACGFIGAASHSPNADATAAHRSKGAKPSGRRVAWGKDAVAVQTTTHASAADAGAHHGQEEDLRRGPPHVAGGDGLLLHAAQGDPGKPGKVSGPPETLHTLQGGIPRVSTPRSSHFFAGPSAVGRL
jgi:hypothetical protein